jgi:DNA repair ATPase RecN
MRKNIEKLNEKITEIARLLAGINVSDITLASAQEMINLAGHK